MDTSGPTVNLITALIKAQSEFKELEKNKTNGHLKYKYADLDSIKNSTMPALRENGLTLNFFPDCKDGVNYLVAVLAHISGECRTGAWKIDPEKPGMQGMGAAITYLKRYIWGSIFSLYEDENDDAIEENIKRSDSNPYQYQKTVSLEQVETITAAQQTELRQMIGNYSDLLKIILKNVEVPSIEDIPQRKYQNILGFVKQSIENRNKMAVAK